MAVLTRERVEQIIKEAQQKGEKPSLSGIDLSTIDLSEVDLSEIDLFEANLSETNLSSANLTGSKLIGAVLHRAVLYKAKVIRADLRKANASEAICTQADFSIASLRSADFTGANFSRADLIAANLSEAKLGRANLKGANLSGADLSRAILDETDLSTADLIGANLSEAVMRKAILRGATVAFTIFADIDLSEVKGLETVWHQGPSTIGIDTLHKSKGRIPPIFLQGAGIPQNFITYGIALFDQAIQFYSCFISYSSKDQDFVERLYADLQQKGVRCWFAPEDIKIGDKIRPTIDQAIRLRDKLLLIFSENSIDSDWVEREVNTALEEEKKRKQTVLFPIRLDEAVMDTDQAWAAEIRRTRHIGDFSRWKDHDAYQTAFERLLRDLKAEG